LRRNLASVLYERGESVLLQRLHVPAVATLDRRSWSGETWRTYSRAFSCSVLMLPLPAASGCSRCLQRLDAPAVVSDGDRSLRAINERSVSNGRVYFMIDALSLPTIFIPTRQYICFELFYFKQLWQWLTAFTHQPPTLYPKGHSFRFVIF
jgi:hypothetical protein